MAFLDVDEDIHSLSSLDSLADYNGFEIPASRYQPIGKGDFEEEETNNGPSATKTVRKGAPPLEGNIIKFMRESKDPFNVGTEDPVETGSVSSAASSTSEAAEAAGAVSAGLSGAGAAAIGGATLGIANLITGLAGPSLQEHAQEKLFDFEIHDRYNLQKQQAIDTGMPLANIMGVGASLPQAQIYDGGNSHFTAGQGLNVAGNKVTASNMNAGYYSF